MQGEVKKPKFKFNFFDILILAALLLVIVFSVYGIVMTENSQQQQGSDGFRYILKAERIENEFVSMISLGDVIYESESGVKLGKVVDITVEDYTETYTVGEKVEIRRVEGYSNLEITVDCHGTAYVNGDGIVNIQSNGYIVRLGTDITVRNTKLLFSAECLLPEKAEVKNEEA